jgi:hypothetical protein
MLHTRTQNGQVDVDGQEYVWELRREPQWCTTDGWQGIAISVRQADAQREAILQFPMPRRATNGSPHRQRPQINDLILCNGISAAIAAGWEPLSRGKPEIFEVDANGC